MRKILIGTIFFWVILNWAHHALADCVRYTKKIANINFQITPSSSSADCFFMISPFITQNLTYRAYTFSNDGNLYVFSSYGPGSNSTTTGAREFYFFPRQQKMEYRLNEESQKLEIQMSNGDIFYFDYQSAQLVGSNLGKFKVNETPQKGDKGGLEILNYQGLYLDAGFALGTSPTLKPEGVVQLADKNSATCQLSNSLLFQYSDSQEGEDGQFKWKDSELHPFLAEQCPQLKW